MFFYSELMNLYTPVEVVSGMPLLSQENNLLLMGSCFASEMGQRLADAKFCCDVNPYGVLYNPFSISVALREIIAGKCYNENDIFLFMDFGTVPCIMVASPQSLQRKHWQVLTDV